MEGRLVNNTNVVYVDELPIKGEPNTIYAISKGYGAYEEYIFNNGVYEKIDEFVDKSTVPSISYLQEELDKMKKENLLLHNEQQKLSRDIIIAIILIAIICIFLLFCFKGFYDMSHDYATGALKMEEDYNALKTRIINIENKIDKGE